jgi:hypothetical protein
MIVISTLLEISSSVRDIERLLRESPPFRAARMSRNSDYSSGRVLATHYRNRLIYAPDQGGGGNVKNSHIEGAVDAAPGRVFTPRPSSIRRNVLSCWYSVVD